MRPHSQKQYSAPSWSFGILIPKKPQIVLACVSAYKHPISSSPKKKTRPTSSAHIRDQTPNHPIPIRRVSPQHATVPARPISCPFEVLLVVRVLQSAKQR
ncbi:hypothetical protein DY000_02042126 [Brassica cretica]|uniref:Uncharacterized protein n=1 Tax=Brassica cretica TaxID=69181 RepID=A0ABQ7B5C0_BRACR|nr:hypothetical protein DY000_02042126 [Brassica cretica]